MLVLIFLCLLFPQISISSAQNTIKLWYSSVLPVLLPFFIICRMIYYNGGATSFAKLLRPLMRFIGIPDIAAFPFAMSLMCGYPTGSRCVSSMQKDGLIDAEFLGNLCYSSGPLFILGSVGNIMLASGETGRALFIIHICTIIIFSLFLKPKQINSEILSFSGTAGDAVSDSVGAILSVCAYMVFFNLIASLIFYFFNISDTLLSGIISGILEFTSGIKLLSQSDSFFALPLISFFLSFGGACVIAQCLSVLNINKTKFILNRVLCGFISFALCIIYKKTAVCVPIIITLTAVLIKKIYLLKSSRS